MPDDKKKSEGRVPTPGQAGRWLLKELSARGIGPGPWELREDEIRTWLACHDPRVVRDKTMFSFRASEGALTIECGSAEPILGPDYHRATTFLELGELLPEFLEAVRRGRPLGDADSGEDYLSLRRGQRYLVREPFLELVRGDLVELAEVLYVPREGWHRVALCTCGRPRVRVELWEVDPKHQEIIRRLKRHLQPLG